MKAGTIKFALTLTVVLLAACTRPVSPTPTSEPDPLRTETKSSDDQPLPTADISTATVTPGEDQTPEIVATAISSSATPAQSAPTATVPSTEERVCDETWVFDLPEEMADHCPQPVLVSEAAAQPFERGQMIWLAQPGLYFVLIDQIMFAGEPRKTADLIPDPLEIIADTSADYTRPLGLYAPVSGFGLVWRGDVANSPGYQDSLGWATASEFAYEAQYQCEVGSVSGGRNWQFCFLLAPNDEIIVFHPLEGWLWLDEWSGLGS